MNKKKWTSCRSASRLIAKATEELGEVAKEYGDVVEATSDGARLDAMHRMCVEIDHVEFILDCLDDVVRTAYARVGTEDEVAI